MRSMTDKKRDFEMACAKAVKARNFTEAAKAAAGAADCAEILASRTTGIPAASTTPSPHAHSRGKGCRAGRAMHAPAASIKAPNRQYIPVFISAFHFIPEPPKVCGGQPISSSKSSSIGGRPYSLISKLSTAFGTGVPGYCSRQAAAKRFASFTLRLPQYFIR